MRAMALKVYAYKGCDTCRRALKFLAAHDRPFELVPIRERPPTLGELERVLARYGGEVRRLFNTSGGDYKALGLKDKLPIMSAAEALKLLAKNGNLVKRPFVVSDDGGLVGFHEQEWRALVGASAAGA
jgi:arsenate reductase